MSAPRMIFESTPGRIEFDSTGRIGSVSVGSRRYLSGGSVIGITVDGQERRPTLVRLDVDSDELDLELDADGPIVSVRHTFAAGWGWRVRLANSGDEPIVVNRTRIELVPAPAMISHAVAAGAEAELIVRPSDGSGAILAGRLVTGGVAELTETELVLPSIHLQPGAGYVLTWHWSFLADASALAERRRGLVPWPLVRTVGEPVDLRTDPDAALLVSEELGTPLPPAGPDGLAVTELVAEQPGWHQVEERSHRGTVTVRLGWAPPLDRLVAERAELLGAQRRSGGSLDQAPGCADQGPGAAGIVLQAALVGGQAIEPDAVIDRLELITADLIEAGPRSGLDAALLCLEHHRTGELEPLRSADQWAADQVSAVPGLGLVITQLCLARVVRGEPLASILRHAAGLAAAISDDVASALDLTTVAELELLAAIHRNLESPAPALRQRLLALGARLSAGQVGPARPSWPAADQAVLIATVLFAGDQAGAAIGRSWGDTPAALAESAVAGLLIDLDSGPNPDEVLAWLTLARFAS